MKILTKIRVYKKCALIMVWLLVFQIVFPSVSMALTSGPTQPEVQSFEPVGATQMVDLFSGDFNYNIPLLEIPGANGGYPINLFYNSVTSADQEASMVGLGWNIGIGALTNQVRGLPDALNGEKVRRKTDMKRNWTVGLGFSVSTPSDLEVFGAAFDVGFIPSPTLGLAPVVNQTQDSWLQLSLGMKGLYNSYKGFGYSIDPGATFNMNRKMGKGPKISANFGFSLNSLEGASSNLSVSLSNIANNNDKVRFGGAGLGVNLNARNGMDYQYNGRIEADINGKSQRTSFGGGSYTFPKTSYTPQSELPYGGTNIALSYKFGGSLFGTFPNATLSGSFSGQWLKNKNKWIESPAYGYMHLQNALSKDKSLMDFNREKDGPIYLGQPNLSTPVLTADILSVAGHGVGGSYRAYRSEWAGTLYDQKAKTTTGGGSLSIEAGAGTGAHVGVDVELNFSHNRTNREKIGNLKFLDSEVGSDFEPFYYKAMGEKTAELKADEMYASINGDKPVHLERAGLNFGNTFKTDLPFPTSVDEDFKRDKGDRRARTSNIQPITNKDLLGPGGSILLPEFDFKIFRAIQNNTIDGSNYETTYDVNRSGANDKIAGYTVINDGGVKWNYGLPVLNKKQSQVTFSVENNSCVKTVDIPGNPISIEDIEHDYGEEYLDITETPEYAHSHLLTSVLGTDYVDINNNGADDADRGYWMKVDYVKTSEEYIWKTPFSGANFIEGYNSKDADDKASFVAGIREQYYPARIETNTHIAEFEYEKRLDSRGALTEINNNDQLGDFSYRLMKIRLYSKIEKDNNVDAKPIKTVHFEYSYDLCSKTPNSGEANKSKLTLKKVWFTYENSSRGSLSPYVFEYNGTNNFYAENAFDRWGSYKEPSGDDCDDIMNPYVDQEDEAKLKNEITSWHLTDINLPSGSNIKINIGRDHYAYVQNKTATRMFNIVKAGGTNSDTEMFEESLGDQDDWDNNTFPEEERKIYFDLEYTTSDQNELAKYFEDLHRTPNGYHQLFYKVNTDLTNSNINEDVTGYVEIERFDFDTESGDITNGYERAYIVLRPFGLRHKGDFYHPIVMGNWQFLKVNLPDQMFGYDLGSYPASTNDKVQKVGQFAGMLSELFSTFRSFYKTCRNRKYGTKFDPEKSFIRLNSPDKLQYGDGVRVEKVVMTDSYWGNFEETPPYGVVYEYETEELEFIGGEMVPTGNMISSGVAANEPAIGKEETALRYAKSYVNDIKNRSDNQFVFEYPVNESYYPGPSIGYSKVTVKSLASDYAIKQAAGEDLSNLELPSDLPSGFATSGTTINEFYTAKDFPVITETTVIDDDDNDIHNIPLPFIGNIRIDHYMGTQGYMIELNDMHGKPKKVTNYAQDKLGHIIPDPISSVEYIYQEGDPDIFTVGGKQKLRRRLDNNVKVLLSDEHDSNTNKTERDEIAELGVEREFFMDIRESISRTGNGGVNFNLDLAGFIPAFSPWPSLGYSDTRMRTSVSNKIIRRSGILQKVIATDGQSIVETENVCYDRFTGAPILTTVNNDYDNKIYNYTIPGHFAYDRMGPAYKNWGLEFFATVGAKDVATGFYPITLQGATSEDIEHIDKLLIEGDELIVKSINEVNVLIPGVYPPDNQLSSIEAVAESRATFIQRNSAGTPLFALDVAPAVNDTEYQFKIIRSGNRNHLGASVGNIVSLSTDPTKGRTKNYCCEGGSGTGSGTMPSHREEDLAENCCHDINYTTKDVLNASATTYADTWSAEENYTCDSKVTTSENPYRYGQRGIWRPRKTYAYVTDRNQTSPVVNLENDGVFDLTLFDWKKPESEFCYRNEGEWRETEEITRYGQNSAALESKNILGLYNSALYGYNDHLPTGVASNSHYYEMGYEGFEEYELTNGSLSLQNYTSTQRETGHIQFLNDCKTQQYNFKVNTEIEGLIGSTDTSIPIENGYFETFGTPNKAIFVLKSVLNGKDHSVETPIQSISFNANNSTLVLNGNNQLSQLLPAVDENGCKEYYAGYVVLCYETDIASGQNYQDVYLSKIAHTGKQSLMVAQFPYAEFKQNILKLQKDEKYVFSAWVYVPTPMSDPVPTYEGLAKVTIGSNEFNPMGPIIEGWQRIEGTFDNITENISLHLYSYKGRPIYYDDIRIFPADGNIQTYVYDKSNYRLTETLDNNNFFTRYKYDSEGNLISVQKETIEGVKTLQEAGSYTQASN